MQAGGDGEQCNEVQLQAQPSPLPPELPPTLLQSSLQKDSGCNSSNEHMSTVKLSLYTKRSCEVSYFVMILNHRIQ